MQTYSSTTAAALAQPESPAAFITNIAFGAMMTQALYVAAKLGIADLLIDKPQHISRLAVKTATDESSLYRVLRSLASIGVFDEVEPQMFALTPRAEVLTSNAANSMRNGAIFMGEAWHWQIWGNMMHSVKTGKTAWGYTHGAEVFDYFPAHPEHAAIFNCAMTDMSMSVAPMIVESYDFSNIETLADIAGGHGYLLAQILKANPKMNGILFDMPPVIEGAKELLEREAVSRRVECVAGDFFKQIPSADAYVLKHIIHDWDDERATLILKNICRAMNEDAKVLIIETVVPEGNTPHYSKLLDLEMLASPGGKERTTGEYKNLLAASGLLVSRIIPTPSPFSIIEAVKADA